MQREDQIQPGTKFNRLTALQEVESKFQKNGNRKRYFLFRCDCGIEKKILLHSVKIGKTQSCGCLNKELIREESKKQSKHNLTGHDLYKRWRKIKGRCLTSTDKRFADYGGRGIKICSDWKENFLSFYEWAIANGYEPHLEIDRIDNNKGYSPENCRFVTTKENCNNTRRNIKVSFSGEEMTLMAACEKAGIAMHYRMIWQRIKEGASFHELYIKYTQYGKNTNI